MPDIDVGLENLPNLYITKIKLSVNRIVVTCLIKDNRENKSWRGREELSDLKVKLVLLHDVRDTLSAYNDHYLKLISGERSLDNYRSSGNNEVVIIQQASSFQKRETADSMGTPEHFYFKDFVINNEDFFNARVPNINNISVFASTYVDGFEFENPLFNIYYGPLSSDIIKESGIVNDTAGYFYNPETNEVYGGPVHYHEGRYMAGSYHSEAPHPVLRFVSEPNTKIVVEY